MLNPSPKKVQLLRYLNLIILGVVLAYGYSYLFLGAYYSHPNAEDLSLSANAKNHSILYSVIDVLVNYDGRYFTNFLHAINPLVFGCIPCYKWVNIFSLLFPVFSLTFFLHSVSPKSNKFHVILGSALFMLVNYAMSPSLVHQVYWMSSSFVYHYSWCFYLLWIGSFLRFLNEKRELRKTLWLAASTILIICSMGMNEMFLAINSLSLMGFFFFFKKQRADLLPNLWPLATSALFALVFFISNPGIIKRLQLFGIQTSDWSLTDAFIKSIQDFSIEAFTFFSYGLLVIPIIILFLLYYEKAVKWKKETVLFYMAWAFLSLFISVLSFYFSMGFENGIPYRIYTTVYFGGLLTLCLGLSMYFNFDGKFNTSRIALKKIISLFCLLAIGSTIMWSNNNINLLKSEFISGKMETFNDQNQMRYTILNDVAQSESSCWKKAVLPTLSNPPKSIYHQPDIKANRKEAYWNKAFEKYFMVDEVSLQGDSISLLRNIQNPIE